MIRSLLKLYAWVPYHPGKWRIVAALGRAAGIRNEPLDPEVVTRQGLRLQLHGACQVQRGLYWYGAWDVHDTAAILHGLRPGDVFFDVGAYFGYYALLAARRGARAYAFEPAPENFALLEANCRLNPALDVRPRQCALSDVPGRASFELPLGGNRGRGHVALSGGIEVSVTTLDAVVEEEKLTRLDAVKIDVEGAEVQVLRGAASALRRFRPRLLVELNPPCLARFGGGTEALTGALRELGYEIRRVDRTPFEGLRAGECYINLLCLPR